MAFTIAEAAVDLSVTGLEKVKQGLGGVKGLLGNLGISPATMGIVGVGGAIAYAVKKAMDWEDAQDDLSDKLATIGEDSDKAGGKINHLAKSIATVTTMSGGQVKALVMQGLNMGLSSDQAERFATVSIGAAKATGKSAEEIMEGTIKLAHGMRTGLDKSLPAIAGAGTQSEKLAVLSKLAGQGFKMLVPDTTKDALEMLQKTISGLYTDLGKVFLPVVGSVINVLQGLADWVRAVVEWIKEFANSSGKASSDFQAAWGSVGDFFGEVADVIGSVVQWIIKQFMLLPTYGQLIGVSLANLFLNLAPAYIMAFGENFVILCGWLWDNWQSIFKTIFNYLVSGFQNSVDNIMSIWNAFWDWINGKGFHVEFKGLTEGAVNEIKQMPQFVAAATDPAWDQMEKEALDKVAKQSAAIDKAWQKHKPTAEKKEAAKEEAKSEIDSIINEGLTPIENLKEKNKKDKGGGFTSIIDIWKNAQKDLMGANIEKEHLNVSKQQLAEQRVSNQLQREALGRRGGKGLALAK